MLFLFDFLYLLSEIATKIHFFFDICNFFCNFANSMLQNISYITHMPKHLSLFITFALACTLAHANNTRYIGGDISALPLYEKDLSYYKDVYGSRITDFITWAVTDCGWNTFRVRIFVNPTKADQNGTLNPSVCQDLAYVTALGKRIKAAGAYFMLDFHYSDTWVDATHIQAPAAWKGKSDAVIADSLGQYTHRVLQALKAAGATPDLVQVGNEIMYGLCGMQVHPYANSGDNWTGYLGLLKAGCNAVREECPNAQIIIHTDRPGEAEYNRYYYKKLIDNGVDYDIIGLSYYPFWHGYLSALTSTINTLNTNFPDKRVQIVECAYNFQNWPSSGINYDTRSTWPCSVAGQYNFVRDLVNTLKPLENVDGISYWFPEEAGNGDYVNWSTNDRLVIKSWLNRGFWDEAASTSGHAINKTGSVSGDKTAADVCAPYYMRNFYYEGTTGIEQTPSETDRVAQKLLVGEQIVIRSNGKTYNLLGQEL